MAFMGYVQSGSWGLKDDGYYHVKMARLLPELGYVQSFPWLHWTIFRDQFISHHHGFQTLLLPFVWIAEQTTGDPTLGGKAAAIFAMGATFALCSVVLRRLTVPHRFLWLVLIGAMPWHFWLRQSYVRAPIVALPLLLLAVLWHLRGRTLAIGILAFLFTQAYGGGVLYPLVSIAFFGAAWLNGDSLRVPFKQCLYSVIGVLLGLVINPYFPANFSFLFTQLFVTGLGASNDVGSEWKSYQSWHLLTHAGILGAVFLGCLLRRLQAAVPTSREELALFLLNVIFLILTMKSRRFVEYWPMFALLSAAAFCAQARRGARPAPGSVFAWTDFTSRPVKVIAGIAVLAGAIPNLSLTRANMESSHNVRALEAAMDFLEKNSPPRSIVFTDDWDTFPVCFYYNHYNRYIVGLDPEFTRTKYPALWERYRLITRAELPAQLTESRDPEGGRDVTYGDIATRFQADYVLVADDHRPLYKALRARPDEFTIIYPPEWKSNTAQPAVAIFAVNPPKND